ncbi:putative class D beta-lactamase precursor [Megalodesulfovibrio gigas DSM 1382 = ATCC 19364]|uniref:beta-lactamase n=1 Tax=Megalodesulfovibrio gigas (strain ATCC 19364 / DSM 1382 / NCIMB 9332 / VKM B-1759) TaxID=1121448 RepID=T2GDU0_MEGG1|nr:putative class D beta-lactamase precursor [Megalodesulfovibrio gigas DSM 1382 = ATCC 19364]
MTMLCCLVLLCACAGRRQAPSATIERPQWGQAFQQAGLQPAQGTMVLLHDGADAVQVYNPARAATPMLPASTFKILNACIALETGVASGPDQVFPWNGVTHSVAAWNRDLTLQEAFAASSVPVFQELARRIGHERMQKYVQQARYGNANIGGEIDSFWLRGALRISAREQLDFLQRLYHNRLPFSRRTMAMVKDIMVVEQGHGWTLRAKTGVAVQDTPHIGWWVGWVERGEKVWFFALNIDVAGPEQYGLRQQIVKTILKAEGILP